MLLGGRVIGRRFGWGRLEGVPSHWSRMRDDLWSDTARGHSGVPRFEEFSQFIASGKVDAADGLLRELIGASQWKDVATPVFNSLITAWLRQGCLSRAFSVFDLLLLSGRTPNAKTITDLLNGCIRTGTHLNYLNDLIRRADLVKPDQFLRLGGHKRPQVVSECDQHVCIKLNRATSLLVDPYERQIEQERSSLSDKVTFFRRLSHGISKESSRKPKRENQQAISSLPSDAEALLLRWFCSLSSAI